MNFFGRKTITYSICLYVVVFAFVCMVWKPAIMFNEHGEIRPFGVWFRHTTVLPVWLFAILAGVLSYLAVLAWL